MGGRPEPLVRTIPIDQIHIPNPRSRDRRRFGQIADNIAALGLKIPIVVCPREDRGDGKKYDLACGQGRLEAYLEHGQTEVPATLRDASRVECYLISLGENLCRRKPTHVEQVRAIERLADAGDTPKQIAKKTHMDPVTVKGIVRLLKQGEERLVDGVMQQVIPISVAVTIAAADEKGVQKALREAYEKNLLRGKALIKARRLIEKRRLDGRSLASRRRKDGKPVSAAALLQAYKREAHKQNLLIKKAKIAETQLLFIESALRKLLRDEGFTRLIRAEDLDTMSQYLASRLGDKGRS